MAQGAVSRDVFSFKLASEGSELLLGEMNPALHTGKVEYHSILPTGFWHTSGARYLVGHTISKTSFSTIIDSGTTIMYGPPEAVKKVYEAVEGAGVFDEDYGYYYYPCNSPPEVSFSWGGRQWSITADK